MPDRCCALEGEVAARPATTVPLRPVGAVGRQPSSFVRWGAALPLSPPKRSFRARSAHPVIGAGQRGEGNGTKRSEKTDHFHVTSEVRVSCELAS